MELTENGIPKCPKDLAKLVDKDQLKKIQYVSELRIIIELTLMDNFPHQVYDYEPPEIIRERVRLVDDTTKYMKKILMKKHLITSDKESLKFRISDKHGLLSPLFFRQKNALDF